jgi:NADH-quinone oxidoreductase subunit N
MGGAMLLLLWAAWRPEGERHARSVAVGGMVVCLVAIAAIVWCVVQGFSAAPGVIAVDNFRWSTDVIILIATILGIALLDDYGRKTNSVPVEAHVLVLLSTSGMMLLGAARDLILVFLGIELMSIAVYVLAGMNRRSARSAEAAMKYFLLGAFSTAFLLYGIALVYGATGSTLLGEIGTRLLAPDVAASPMLLVGIAMLLVGFAFKIAAVPFHMWTPDVYDGAPMPVTAYMAAAVKAAAFAVLLRVFYEALPGAIDRWHPVVWWMAVSTMVLGNVVALVQRNIKRMLAYSSIAHAGYLLVTVVTNTDAGAAAMIFYLLAYTLATMGAFAVLVSLSEGTDRPVELSEYNGLWHVQPGLAMAMAIYMLALLGFPIAGGMGFFAKWYVLQAALQAPTPQTNLVIVLVATSVVSAGYYLYVIMVMFMRPRPANAMTPAPTPGFTRFVIGFTVALILILGVVPTPVVRVARLSAPTPPRAAAPAPPTAVPIAASAGR